MNEKDQALAEQQERRIELERKLEQIQSAQVANCIVDTKKVMTDTDRKELESMEKGKL